MVSLSDTVKLFILLNAWEDQVFIYYFISPFLLAEGKLQEYITSSNQNKIFSSTPKKKPTIHSLSKALANKQTFQTLLKISNEVETIISSGSPFHRVGTLMKRTQPLLTARCNILSMHMTSGGNLKNVIGAMERVGTHMEGDSLSDMWAPDHEGL